MEAPGGVEPPTNSLGNCCSIQLSYGAVGEAPRSVYNGFLIGQQIEGRDFPVSFAQRPIESEGTGLRVPFL